MTTNQFQKAVRTQAKLRMAINGPSGAGKTYTALIAAKVMANGGKIAMIDTERGSASLYSDKYDFDTATLNEFNPQNYIDLIKAAEESGYAVIVIDSLTHAWEGKGGALDLVDDAAKRSKSKNTFTAWKDVTPLHRQLIDAMLQSPCHIIATMRSKTEYVIESVERNGRQVQTPRKVGMAPIQRQGMEYEFTIVGDMDLDHNFVVSKSHMEALADQVEKKPGEKFFRQVYDWLNSGTTVTEKPKPEKPVIMIADIAAKTTPKGTPLGKLTNEQLQVVVQNAKNGLKEAAEYLLAKAAGDDWATWYELVSQAGANGVNAVDLPDGATRIEMHRQSEHLREEMEKVGARGQG